MTLFSLPALFSGPPSLLPGTAPILGATLCRKPFTSPGKETSPDPSQRASGGLCDCVARCGKHGSCLDATGLPARPLPPPGGGRLRGEAGGVHGDRGERSAGPRDAGRARGTCSGGVCGPRARESSGRCWPKWSHVGPRLGTCEPKGGRPSQGSGSSVSWRSVGTAVRTH